MIIEPQCDMCEWAYKDWLADQGFDELRDIDFASFVSGLYFSFSYHQFYGNIRCSVGDGMNYREDLAQEFYPNFVASNFYDDIYFDEDNSYGEGFELIYVDILGLGNCCWNGDG